MTRHWRDPGYWDRLLYAAAALAIVLAFAACGWAIYGTSRRSAPPEQLRRVTFEGQECVVIENWNGRLRGIDCDWTDR